MTTKEQLKKVAEQKLYEAKQCDTYAEIIDFLESRQRSWYGIENEIDISDNGEATLPMIVPYQGMEAEYEAYENAIKAIMKLAGIK